MQTILASNENIRCQQLSSLLCYLVSSLYQAQCGNQKKNTENCTNSFVMLFRSNSEQLS